MYMYIHNYLHHRSSNCYNILFCDNINKKALAQDIIYKNTFKTDSMATGIMDMNMAF